MEVTAVHRSETSMAPLATRRFPVFWWVTAAFIAAAVFAAVTLVVVGPGPKGIDESLRLTGRFSFLLFWPAYAGGILRRYNVPLLAGFSAMRREFGLSFAGAHSVHVALIIWLFGISHGAPVTIYTIALDGIGIVWVYVLAGFSLDYLKRKISRKTWNFIFNFGLEYIALVFLSDFLFLPLVHGHALSITYLPFTILLLAVAIPRWLNIISDFSVRILRI